jgi:hypothetical protein
VQDVSIPPPWSTLRGLPVSPILATPAYRRIPDLTHLNLLSYGMIDSGDTVDNAVINTMGTVCFQVMCIQFLATR